MIRTITSKTFLTSITMIYYVIIFTMTLFGLVSYYVTPTATTDESTLNMFRYMLAGLTPFGLTASYFGFKRMVSSIEQSMPLQTKLSKYQAAVLVRAASLQVPGLLSAVATFLTGNPLFLVVMAAMIAAFIFFRPTLQALIEDLPLTAEEQSRIEDPTAVLYSTNDSRK